MELNFTNEGKYTEIFTNERLDATNADSFDTQVNEYVSSNTDLSVFILNLENVEYVSSAGLRSILKLAKLCNAKKIKLYCCGIRPEVMEVFQISGFTVLLDIKSNKTEVVASL